jgi:hypothetical protein
MPTELNRQLASAVQYAVAADRFYIAGKSNFWRLIGLGFVGLGLGGAVGLGFYGYGEIRLSRENMGSLSAAFSQALSKVQLSGKATGTVQFEPHEVTLAKDQTISIDPNSTVRLDPNAKVRAEGDIRIQATTQTPTNAPSAKPETPLITNFTVFKRVPFGKGAVMTGWNFVTNRQRSPTSQYCYYTQTSNQDINSDMPGLSVQLDLGEDQKLDAANNLPTGFDLKGAFERCVWFRS